MKINNKSLRLLVLIIVLSNSLFISCRTISVTTHTIKTPLLEENSIIRIVLISDLHNSIHGADQSILIDKIKNANPDLIVLAGDIIDNFNTIRGTRLLLSRISGIAPVYFVTGNHEFASNDIHRIRRELVSHGVIILSDTYKIVEIGNNKIVLAGIEDPSKALFETPGYDQSAVMEKVFRELDEVPLFKILIAHRPEMIELYKKFSFDLVLAGHAHGGQVRTPFRSRGLYAPNQGIFPRFTGGMYTFDSLSLIVSRGLSLNHPRMPRIFNYPELVIVDIKSESAVKIQTET